MASKLPTLQFNKVNFFNLEQERNMLKVTLNYLSNDNLKLKQQLEDMRMTVRHNKEQLDEYVTKITNKDKVFEKMNNQIEQLTSRLKILEAKKKHQSKKVLRDNNEMKNITNAQASTNSNTIVNSSSIETKEGTTLFNTKRSEEKFKEFFLKQSEIFEEMNILKDDVQFLLENKSKTKLKEHLNQSITSNRSYHSNNSSLSHSNRNYSGIIDNDSILNSSIISNISTNTVKKKFNLKDRFQLNDNLSHFLFNINSKKNIVLLIDNKDSIWELVKRKDLSIAYVKSHPEYIKSIVPNDIERHTNNNAIDSREYDNRSLKQSELDLSKSDFNLSRMIKESDLI